MFHNGNNNFEAEIKKLIRFLKIRVPIKKIQIEITFFVYCNIKFQI
jgi:hypothetical protein